MLQFLEKALFGIQGGSEFSEGTRDPVFSRSHRLVQCLARDSAAGLIQITIETGSDGMDDIPFFRA